MIRRPPIATLPPLRSACLLVFLGLCACGNAKPRVDVQGDSASRATTKSALPLDNTPANTDTSKPWYGYWESENTSKGGIGTAIYITPKLGALSWMCVIVDGRYTFKEGILTQHPVSDQGEPHVTKVQVNDKQMTLLGEKDAKQVLTRVGTGTGIVGAWKMDHYTGQEAFQRFGDNETTSFRLIMGVITIQQIKSVGNNTVELLPGKRMRGATCTVRDGFLVSDEGKFKYKRVGDRPWYPLPGE